MIYLDNNATTQVAPRVLAAMLPFFTETYHNASAQIASLVGADKPRVAASVSMTRLINAESSDSFVFTSGATESNNWVFWSVMRQSKKGRILISEIEHPSITEPAAMLAQSGFEVETVPVDRLGVIDLKALRNKLTKDTVLVSVMSANNETGVVQPIEAIGRVIRETCADSLFHTDATQAVGKIRIDLSAEWNEVDLLSFSGHKFHGPKGIGGLYIRPGIEMDPMIVGGGQEGGMRSGTSNTPSLAGLAMAADEARAVNQSAIQELRDDFEAQLQKTFLGASIHSKDAARVPNTSYFSLPDIRGEHLVDSLALVGIIIGTGAACSDGATNYSKTLSAMGVPQESIVKAVRISLSRFSTKEETSELLFQMGQILRKKTL